MKTTFLAFAFATALFLSGVQAAEPLPPVLGTDSLGLPYRILFQADGGVITAVHITGDILNVEFTGHWLSSSHAKFSETDKNGFVVERDKETSPAAWDALARRFTASQGKPVTILVFVDHGYQILGGIPLFRFPQDRFQIFNPGDRFNFPVGYQF